MARPYGLLLAFTALSFAFWQEAALTDRRRAWPLCGLALAIAGAVLSHHFGMFHVGIFLAAGETTRLIQRRRLDLRMAAAIVAGLSPLAVTIPFARRSSRVLGQAILHSSNFWAKPSPADLANYLSMIALPLLCLVAIFALLPWPERKTPAGSDSLPPVPLHEWIAALALCLLLPAVIVLTSFETGYFQPKYAISTSLGLALLGAWALPRLLGRRFDPQPLLALSTLGSLLVVVAFLLRVQIYRPVEKGLQGVETVSPLLLRAPADLPIVVCNAFDYAPDWWYAPPSLQKRLVYLSDLTYAARQTDFLPEFSLVLDREFIPIPVPDYSPYIAAHQSFLLLRSGEARLNWTDARLANSGWRLTPIDKAGADILYQVDRP
jgi:hypothetical protein